MNIKLQAGAAWMNQFSLLPLLSPFVKTCVSWRNCFINKHNHLVIAFVPPFKVQTNPTVGVEELVLAY